MGLTRLYASVGCNVGVALHQQVPGASCRQGATEGRLRLLGDYSSSALARHTHPRLLMPWSTVVLELLAACLMALFGRLGRASAAPARRRPTRRNWFLDRSHSAVIRAMWCSASTLRVTP
jgi:hypothetical protein